MSAEQQADLATSVMNYDLPPIVSLAYWKEHLGGAPVVDMPTDHPRPPQLTFAGAMCQRQLSSVLTAALCASVARDETSWEALGTASVLALLHRYTGQAELTLGVVGLPGATSGSITAPRVVRQPLQGSQTFRLLQTQVQVALRDTESQWEVPFDILALAVEPVQDPSRAPLFQIQFQVVTEAELAARSQLFSSELLDLTIQLVVGDTTLSLRAEYNTLLFEHDRIARLLGHLETLLTAVEAEPDCPIAALPLLTAAEVVELETWNATGEAFPTTLSLGTATLRWVQETPDAIAVRHDGQSITYRELYARATQLAYVLLERGVQPEEPVAVFVERSADQIVALLGITLAGATYVPIDPIYPAERIGYILEDLAQRQGDRGGWVVTQQTLAEQLPGDPARRLRIEALPEAPSVPLPEVNPAQLAYMMFTSGSTGRPKGVMIPHHTVWNLLEGARRRFGFGPNQRIPNFHSYGFDVSVWEIWGSLTSGGTVVVVDSALLLQPERFVALLEAEQVTLLMLPAAFARAIVENVAPERLQRLSSLRLLFLGGEALPGALAARLLPLVPALWNVYGPTETTVWSTCHPVTSKDTELPHVTIGRPLVNQKVTIRDSNGTVVPVGIAGELWIGGSGLARGYLNRPELTVERFVERDGERWYRTGDLARWQTDGTILFLGRLDHQVKLRGFRIELEEIEAVLRRCAGIDDAVVVARDERLIAYYVGSASTEALRDQLGATLPGYMVPTAWLRLDALPLNTNGKVDRKALPSFATVRTEGSGADALPATDLQRQLQQLWQQVLRLPRVGMHESFFELGGNSLLAIQLFTQIEAQFGRKLPLATLLHGPTVAQLSAILADKDAKLRYHSLVAIQPEGTRPPLFCLHGAGGQVLFYTDLAHHLGKDQPVYGLQARAYDPNYPKFETVEQMATHYIQELQVVQPQGPYYICGTSLGGTIAYEMAQQLQAKGEHVAMLGFFDAYHPDYLRYRPGITRYHRLLFSSYRTLEHHLRSILRLGPVQRPNYIRSRSKHASYEVIWFAQAQQKRVTRWFGKLRRQPVPQAKPAAPHPLRTPVQKYKPQPYSGKLTLFRSERQPLGIYPNPTLGWGELVQGKLDIRVVPGFHAAIVVEPWVPFLVAELKSVLEQARSEAGEAAR